MRDGRPAYVTAVSRSDVVGGWRERREAGGSVIDVASGEFITESLSMPHSPRVYRDQLWVLDSGSGDLGRVDLSSGAFDPLCFAPGFLRGLAFHGNLAVVGLSKPRREGAFSGLALDERLREKDAEAKCGLYMIDTDTGVVAHRIELEGVVEELYDVVVIPDVATPTVLGFRNDDIANIITIETERGPVTQAAPRTEAKAAPPPQHEPNAEARRLFKAADALVREGKLEDAVDTYVEGLVLDPHDPDALTAIASTQAELGRLAEAVDCIRRAVIAAPASVQTRVAAAALLIRVGAQREAIDHLREALGRMPEDVHIATQLGNALYFDGRFEEAKAIFEHALRVKPGNAEAHNGLGAVAGFYEDLDESLKHYERAAELAPRYLEAHQNVGGVHEQRGDILEAQTAYRRALEIEHDPVLALHTELVCPPVMRSNDDIDEYRKYALEVIESYNGEQLDLPFDRVQSSRAEPPFAWAYHGRDNLELKTKYAALFVSGFAGRGVERVIAPSPPWRIGFVVTPTHEGIFGRLMSGVVNRMDPARFSIEVICSKQGAALLRQVIRARHVRFRELPWRFDHAVEAIRRADLDAIYHWEVGTDAVNQFLGFLRLAPVQCTGWGWPDTSGAPAVDYHLTTAALAIPGIEERFSEKLVALPELPGWVPSVRPVERPMARAHFGLEDADNVYLCHQTLRKVHPDMDALVAGILKADRSAVVAFVADKHVTPGLLLRGRWARTLSRYAGRIVMVPRLEPDEYFHLVSNADVCLDTPHFGGTVTMYDALGAGKPVVTLPGEQPRSRNAAALAVKAGIADECVASDPRDYIDKAVALGTERSVRADIARRINDARSEIFERSDSVTQLEDFFADVLG